MSIDSSTDSELRSTMNLCGWETRFIAWVAAKSPLTLVNPTKRGRNRVSHFGLTRLSAMRMRSTLAVILLFVFELVANAAATNSEQDKLTKLAPEPVSVQVENGSGSLNLVFILKSGSEVPAFKVTSAVGGAHAIPETDIVFEWSTTPALDQASKRTLLVANLNVKTRVFVEPNVEYKGRIIFFWPDSEQWIEFTVVDRNSLSFDLLESKLDLVLGPNQPPTVPLHVKNSGKAEIQVLTISSSDLVDNETQHRATLPITIRDLKSEPVRPTHELEVSIAIPSPEMAGSYAGTLYVVANGRFKQSIPIVLRTRGPITSRGLLFLPFLLFVASLILGFWLSTKLDDWFNLGGLQRSQALVSLQQSEQSLARLLDQLRRWETVLAATAFPQATIRLEQSLQELRGLLGTFSDIPQDQLIAEAQRYALILAQANLLRGFAEVAMKRWAGDTQRAKLLQVLTALDAAPPVADLNTYRENLRKTLSESADDSGASLAAVNEALPPVPRPADLRAKIKSMARLQRIVVLLVVFISAYQIFYAHHFSFGTLLDYLGVFLWTLGLTQTGSQILVRARSTYNPAP